MKYRFAYKSQNGVITRVEISNGSGSFVDRPLGKAPVIRMQNADPFRSTSCELTLECQSDGEYSSFYTSDPREYRVSVYRGGSSFTSGGILIWTGFLATELYSEPDIAPPYDVRVTATDGLGVLKEYDFTACGPKTLRKHIQDLLEETGLTLDLYSVSQLKETGGSAASFLDSALINLDYMDGKSCYDVLSHILVSIHATITQQGSRWVVIRETDVTISGGSVSAIQTPGNSTNASSTTTISAAWTVGQMGVSGNAWPIGFMTRTAVPAKKDVTVQAPWHLTNGAPPLGDSRWSISGHASFSTNKYIFPSNGGLILTTWTVNRFDRDIKITVRASMAANASHGRVYAYASWMYGNDATVYYYNQVGGRNGALGWSTGLSENKDFIQVDDTNVDDDPSLAQEVTITIPSILSSTAGVLSVFVGGVSVNVYGVSIELLYGKGYEDRITINNGARGSGDTVEISGGRLSLSNLIRLEFLDGVFYSEISGGGTHPIVSFSDLNYSNRDFMSLQALGRALSVALPRVERSGTVDCPSDKTNPPLFISASGTSYIVTEYDFNLKNDELNFKAVSLPAASLSVLSETVTTIPGTASAGGSSAGSSSSGGSVETDPVFSASPAAGIPAVTSGDNGKVLKVANGAYALGTVETGSQVAFSSYDSTKKTVMLTVDGSTREMQQYGYDTALSPTSENPVQNKVIYAAIGDIETLLAAL